MSNIIVEYDSIENAIPSVNSLSADCEGLKGKVDGVASDIDGLSGKHDDCFAGTIGALDMFSGFITKMGSEYEAVASVANTALGAFKNAEGKITADTEKIADLKWLLVYLGMDSEACNDLDFEKINSGKADISKYEAYYKDTNADLSSSINSEIADMLLIEDGKGGYKVLTRSEIEEYIKEQSKADTTSSAESTADNYSGDSSSSRGTSGSTGARSSSSSSSSTSNPSTSGDGTTEERRDEDSQKPDEEKPEEQNSEEQNPETGEEQTAQEGNEEQTAQEENEEQPAQEQNEEQPGQEQNPEQPAQEQPAAPAPAVAAVGGDAQVPVQQPVSVAPSNVSNIGIGNAAPQVGSTTAPEPEAPVATPEPEQPEVPNIENTNSTSGTTTSGTTRHTTTIPSTTPSPSTTNNNGGSPAKFIFPALGAVAAAGAAGVGAKMYLDKKNGEEESDEMEEYNEYDVADDTDYSTEDDYNPNSSIQAPDSSWSLDNTIEENKY